MATLQPIGQTRTRVITKSDVVIQTPLAGSLDDPLPQKDLGQETNDLIVQQEKDIAIAIAKERQEIVRKVIKIRVIKKGAVEAFKETDGFIGSAFHKYCEEYDANEDSKYGKIGPKDTFGIWFTLSPEPGTCTVHQIHETMQKLSTKKGVALMIWSLENYGLKGEHPHAHAIIVLDKVNGGQSAERRKMIATIERVCKSYKTKTSKYLECKYLSEKNYKSKLDYVKGKKYDKAKAEKVELDKVWRKENALQDYYIYPPMNKIGEDN